MTTINDVKNNSVEQITQLNRELEFIINGAETRRFHTWPVLRSQTVAHHSSMVAMLCAWVASDREEVGISAKLLMAALTHDWAEWVLGDLPAPAKRSLPDVPLAVIGEGGEITMTARPFKEVWDELEQEQLRRHNLWWEDQLTPEELRILKFCDAVDGALYCCRERAMGNKLMNAPYQNFKSYLNEHYQPQHAAEHTLVRFVQLQWRDACA